MINPHQVTHEARLTFEEYDAPGGKKKLATIDILVMGKTKRQVLKRYRKIMQGKTRGRYKGDPVVPQGCEGDPEVARAEQAEYNKQEDARREKKRRTHSFHDEQGMYEKNNYQ